MKTIITPTKKKSCTKTAKRKSIAKKSVAKKKAVSTNRLANGDKITKKEHIKFIPEVDFMSIPQYGIMAIELNKPLKKIKTGRNTHVSVPKENLGTGLFQREIQTARVNNIREDFRYPYGTPVVKEIYFGGKYYYIIVDGQHRACACPYDVVDCLMDSGEKPPVDGFLTANNPKLVKTVSKEDQYWAEIYKYKSDKTKIDQMDHVYVHNIFVDYGFIPLKSSDKVERNNRDFGVAVSNIHHLHKTYIIDRLDRFVSAQQKRDQYSLSTQAQVNLRRQVFSDTFKMVMELFGKESFSRGNKRTALWCGAMTLLTVHLGWEYNIDDVINILKRGHWCRYARGRSCGTTLQYIKNWEDCSHEYARSVLAGRQMNYFEIWSQLFWDVYRVSQREFR